jgi:hypothetical protein
MPPPRRLAKADAFRFFRQLVNYVPAVIEAARLGCATHPDGQPGAAIVQVAADWLTAHELGHVLGLRHVCTMPTPANPMPSNPCMGAGHSDSLMFPNIGWTNTPPDLATSEEDTIRGSGLTNSCL